jgi:hypothetical protein
MKKFLLVYIIFIAPCLTEAQTPIYRQDTGFVIYHDYSTIFFIPVKNFYQNGSIEMLTERTFTGAIEFMYEIWDSLYLNKWTQYKVLKDNERKIDKILISPAIVAYYIGKNDKMNGILYHRKYKLLIDTKKKWIRFNVDLRKKITICSVVIL